jgi:predicted nucleic acid-binding protein
MSDSVFADTNVLVYLFDRDAPAKQRRAREVLEEEGDRLVVSTQVLQEFYVTVTRKLGRPLAEGEAEAATRDLSAFEVVEPDLAMVLRSISSSRGWKISLWDALIVEAARARGCARLLSEDMQHGRLFGTVRVENPFRRA